MSPRIDETSWCQKKCLNHPARLLSIYPRREGWPALSGRALLPGATATAADKEWKKTELDACSSVASEDRAHDLRIMRPARYQLRYCHPVMKAIFDSIFLSSVLWPLFGFRMVKNMAG